MALAYNFYTGDGTTTAFAFTKELNVKATVVGLVDYVSATGTWNDLTATFTFDVAPVTGSAVYVMRSTSLSEMVATYPNKSYLTSENLDADFRQMLMLAQENDAFATIAFELGNDAAVYAAQAEASAVAADLSATYSADAAASSLLSSVAADASEAAALASELKANEWAEKAWGVEVEPGEYSAKHWATEAENTVTQAVIYRGTWDASTGVYPTTPTPVSGDYWKITVAGTISGTVYAINDGILYNTTSGWDKIDNTESVSSVAGKVGAVVLDSTDVSNVVDTLTNQTIAGEKTLTDQNSIYSSHGQAAWSMDTAAPDGYGKRRITCNDGGGNWNFHSSVYVDNSLTKSALAGDGGTSIVMTSDGVPGSMQFRTASAVSVAAGDTLTMRTNLAFSYDNMTFDSNMTQLRWARDPAHDDDLVRKAFLAHRGVLAYKSVAQSIPNAAWTNVVLGGEDYDTDGIHSTSVNNHRMTVPSGVTKIRLIAQVTWSVNTTGNRYIRILKNGSLLYPGALQDWAPTIPSNSMTHHMASPVIAVTGGQYFDLQCYQNSGAALNVIGEAGGNSTWMSMEIIE